MSASQFTLRLKSNSVAVTCAASSKEIEPIEEFQPRDPLVACYTNLGAVLFTLLEEVYRTIGHYFELGLERKRPESTYSLVRVFDHDLIADSHMDRSQGSGFDSPLQRAPPPPSFLSISIII